MAAARRKWIRSLAALAVLLAAGAALWFAHARGWLDPAYAWLGHAPPKEMSHSEHGGMSMPGMESGAHGSPSQAPGLAEVIIPGEVQQRIGVTTGKVERAPLRMSVRTVGIVEPNETKVSHVHLRTEGWVDKVFVGYTGQKVAEGAPLLAIYSPDFLATQREYLAARQAEGSPAGGKQTLAGLALQRLELWGVPSEEIKRLKETGKSQTYLTLRSPQNGTVLVKNAFPGQYVTPKMDLYVVADLKTIWVQAKVYEYELPHVHVGQPANVTLPALPSRMFPGKVVFIQPTVDEKTRTVQVRVELPNSDGLLRPGMFAHVVIEHTMGKGLLVPASAIIRTGERDIAYRVAEMGRFVPVVVNVGPLLYEGGRLEVLEGLKAGERVVTSANFLIDSESRLRVGGMAGMAGMDMGGRKDKDMKGMDHSKMKH